MRTETPSSAVGKRLPEKSDSCHDRVNGDRFVPKILIQEAEPTTASKMAALTTARICGLAACADAHTTGPNRPSNTARMFKGRWRSSRSDFIGPPDSLGNYRSLYTCWSS